MVLFRPDENFKRLNNSCEALCIPKIDAICYRLIKETCHIDRDWVPDSPGTSLYIRPFIIAAEPLSAYIHHQIIVYNYRSCWSILQGRNYPVKIYVEQKYVRAVKGDWVKQRQIQTTLQA